MTDELHTTSGSAPDVAPAAETHADVAHADVAIVLNNELLMEATA